MVIKYSKDSLKFLSKLDKKSVARIRAAIQDLTLTPPKGDIKVMQGYNDDRKRLRVGSWRIIYKYGVDNEIDILNFYCVENETTKEDETDDFKHYCELRDSSKAFHIYRGCRRKWMNETDDDEHPRKVVPRWAETIQLKRVRSVFLTKMIDLDSRSAEEVEL